MKETALQALSNGAHAGRREQTIHTPKNVLMRVRMVFGSKIQYDPCWSPGCHTDPVTRTHIHWNCMLDAVQEHWSHVWGDDLTAAALQVYTCQVRAKDATTKAVHLSSKIADWVREKYAKQSGHLQHWPDRTFCNPPFGNRGPYCALGGLREFCEAFANADTEVIMLTPVRSQRKWWRESILGTADAVTYLDSVKFDGYSQPFPAPVCLAYKGKDPLRMANIFTDIAHTVIPGEVR